VISIVTAALVIFNLAKDMPVAVKSNDGNNATMQQLCDIALVSKIFYCYYGVRYEACYGIFRLFLKSLIF
jgi:hypothetical protein